MKDPMSPGSEGRRVSIDNNVEVLGEEEGGGGGGGSFHSNQRKTTAITKKRGRRGGLENVYEGDEVEDDRMDRINDELTDINTKAVEEGKREGKDLSSSGWGSKKIAE